MKGVVLWSEDPTGILLQGPPTPMKSPGIASGTRGAAYTGGKGRVNTPGAASTTNLPSWLASRGVRVGRSSLGAFPIVVVSRTVPPQHLSATVFALKASLFPNRNVEVACTPLNATSRAVENLMAFFPCHIGTIVIACSERKPCFKRESFISSNPSPGAATCPLSRLSRSMRHFIAQDRRL